MKSGPGVTLGRIPTKGFRRTAVGAVISTYLLVVAGGVVRVTGSGLGCGAQGNDWPLCHGHLIPPADAPTLIEYSHRWLAFITTMLIGVLAVWAWRRYRHLPRVFRVVSAVVLLLIVQILLGALTVELRLPGGIVLVHLANALLLLGVLISAVVACYAPASEQALTERQRRAARQMAVAAGAVYLLVLTGGLVVANGAGYACAGWPLCGNGFQLDSSNLAVFNEFHRFVAGAVGLFLGWSVARVIVAFRGRRPVRIAAMAVNLVLLAQIAVGAILVDLRLPTPTRGAHEALASLLWAASALLAVMVYRGRVPQEAWIHGALASGRPEAAVP